MCQVPGAGMCGTPPTRIGRVDAIDDVGQVFPVAAGLTSRKVLVGSAMGFSFLE
jgi:hypothetical protein